MQPIAASDELESLRAGDETAFMALVRRHHPAMVRVARIRATIRLAGRVTPDDLSPEAERELLAAFRSWHSE